MATHPRLWRLPAKESDGAASQESPMPRSQGGWHGRVTFWTHPTRTAEEESVERPWAATGVARAAKFERATPSASVTRFMACLPDRRAATATAVFLPPQRRGLAQ